MYLVGKIIEFSPVESGTSPKGEWKKRTVVIRTLEQDPVLVAFTAFNKRVETLEPFVLGDVVNVSFGVSSRKFQDRWFSDLQLWGIQNV